MAAAIRSGSSDLAHTGGVDRRRLARLTTAIGVAVAVAGVVFVVRAIAGERAEVADALDDARPWWLVPAFAAGLAGMATVGSGWRAALHRLGVSAARRSLFFWYFAGQLGKYVPGGVWPLVGRGELARRGGVPRPVAYSSVVLSLGATYLAAALLVAVLIPVGLGAGGAAAAAAVAALVPLGLAVLHPAVLSRVVGLAERLARRSLGVSVPTWGTGVALVARHVPAWLLIGGATWSVARALHPDPPLVELLYATTLSWVVGFVVVPVPGGLGVREAAFAAAATPALSSGVAATVAVVARVLFMVVDLTGAAVATALRPSESRPASPAAPPGVGR